MQPYIILQYSYETIEIALCNHGQILTQVHEHKFNAIKSTLPHIDTMLKQHNLTLNSLSFIGVNVGPGPYNTLRALLTMANGIHFTANTPLIGACALQLLSTEIRNANIQQKNILIIFQAFANHVFYRFESPEITEQGACTVDQLINKINHQKLTWLATGNGAHMYQATLQQATNNKVIFSEPMIMFNSLNILATDTWEKYQRKEFESGYLKPIYFEDLKS